MPEADTAPARMVPLTSFERGANQARLQCATMINDTRDNVSKASTPGALFTRQYVLNLLTHMALNIGDVATPDCRVAVI